MESDPLKAASIAMKAGRWEEAVSMLEPLVLGEPSFAALWNLGWALFKLGDRRVARDYLARAVKTDPTRAVGHWALGSVLLEDGLYPDAEASLSRALDLRDSTLGRLSLALALMRQGKFADAEDVHLKGLEIAPDSTRRLDAYADFLDDAGRCDEANAIRMRASQLRRIN